MIRFKLVLYNHGFHVKPMFNDDREIVVTFNKDLDMYESRWNFKKRRMEKVFKVSYTTFNVRSTTYGMHRNLLESFIEHLHYKRVTDNEISIETYVPVEGEPTDLEFNPKLVLRPHQPPIVKFITDPGKTKVLPLQTGFGKFLGLDDLVKIPGGWKRNGDISLGDIVIAKDGTHSNVIGVYPQGLQDLYKITFSDGRSAECGLEHLWRVYYVNTSEHKRWRIVNTEEIIRLINMPNPRVYIDLIDPEIIKDVDLPIDPYVLGVILGDGSSHGYTINITTPDKFIANQVSMLLGKDYKLTTSTYINKCPRYNIVRSNLHINSGIKGFHVELNKLGLQNKLSYEKFIPTIYLNASVQQRLSLVQGLLDTDGTVGTGGTISYTTTSLQLAEHMQYLIRSLGGVARMTSRFTNFTYKGEYKQGRRSYTLYLKYKKPTDLFRLPRKKNRNNDLNQYSSKLKLKVKSVEFIGKKEAQCISIDHPDHLYITNDFIVTHNTITALYAIGQMQIRSAIIMGAMHVETWLKEVQFVFVDGLEHVTVIRGKAAMVKLIKEAQNHTLTKSIIIFTVHTIRDYLKEYEEYNKSTYGCIPSELYNTLGVGFRVSDEAHENLHFGFRSDIEMNVNKALYLSATIEAHEAFTNRLYGIIFPRMQRYTGLDWRKYINAFAIGYHVCEPEKIQCLGGSGMYSHVAYEHWIMKDPARLHNYLEMMLTIVKKGFITNYLPGQKMLIFMSTIDLCKTTAEYLQAYIDHLSIVDYTGEHEDVVLHTNDIVVTTPGSAGTGKDVSGLSMVLNTVAMSKREKNIQMLGRLRELDKMFPGVEPVFYYLICKDIPKHIQYHTQRVKLFEQYAKSIQVVNSTFTI